jgi:hypothetical protein
MNAGTAETTENTEETLALFLRVLGGLRVEESL